MTMQTSNELTIAQARDRFLERNGFTMESYDAPTVEIPLGPVSAWLPNTAGRKAVVRWHDLHHVVTGYGTDMIGEAEIGAWELRAGCTTMAAYVLNSLAVLLGLVLAPRRILRAFSGARGARSLYRMDLDYDDALRLTVASLRSRAGVPRDGAAEGRAQLHTAAPAR